MSGTVALVVIDGLRPEACRHPFFERMKNEGSWTYNAVSLDPPITYPVHVSLFTGLSPQEHGYTDNQAPSGDCGLKTLPVVAGARGLKTAWFADWEPFLHIVKPEDVAVFEYTDTEALRHVPQEEKIRAQIEWTRKAADVLRERKADLLFFHFMLLDHMGHRHGWMSEPYLAAADLAAECTAILRDALGPEDTLILLADHGGHDKDHFDPADPRDMTVPVWCAGRGFTSGTEMKNVSLLDIAPTVCDLLGLECEFSGNSLVNDLSR